MPEKKEPNFTHLKQIGTGRLFVRTDVLAARKDMVPYDIENPDAIAPGFEGRVEDPVTQLTKFMRMCTKEEVLLALDRVFGNQLYGQPKEDPVAEAQPTSQIEPPAKTISQMAEEIVVSDDDPLLKLPNREAIAQAAKDNLDPGILLDITKSRKEVVAEYRAAEQRLNAMRSGA